MKKIEIPFIPTLTANQNPSPSLRTVSTSIFMSYTVVHMYVHCTLRFGGRAAPLWDNSQIFPNSDQIKLKITKSLSINHLHSFRAGQLHSHARGSQSWLTTHWLLTLQLCHLSSPLETTVQHDSPARQSSSGPESRTTEQSSTTISSPLVASRRRLSSLLVASCRLLSPLVASRRLSSPPVASRRLLPHLPILCLFGLMPHSNAFWTLPMHMHIYIAAPHSSPHIHVST